MTYFYLAMIESLATCFLMQNSLKKPDEFDNKITRDWSAIIYSDLILKFVKVKQIWLGLITWRWSVE